MKQKPALTQVVAALIWREGKVLICQRPSHKARALLRAAELVEEGLE